MLPAGTGQKICRDELPERLQKRVISSTAVKYLIECASPSFSPKIAMIRKKCKGRGSLWGQTMAYNCFLDTSLSIYIKMKRPYYPF